MKGLFIIFTRRGYRIRAGDKNLFLKFVLSRFGTLYFLLLALLNIGTVKNFLKDKNSFQFGKYHIFTIVFPLLIVSVLGYLYYYFRVDAWKRKLHRQELARMVLDNGWHNQNKNGKVKDFPKMYYKMNNGFLSVSVRITMGRYQDQFLHLEKKLEAGLFCELVTRESKEPYIEYNFLYDTVSYRVEISEVKAKGGSMNLMQTVAWEYDELPHMLIAGGTGSGKTYFILTLINALVKTNVNLFILDPKNSDLADLKQVLPEVYSKRDDMLACLDRFLEGMLQKNDSIKDLPDYKMGYNYAHYGLPANFLIFDEYVAFMDMLGRDSTEVMSKLKQIVMLGRQCGYFLILACQRPDAKYLGDGIRDQFYIRLGLGRMSELGYGMLFGETKKEYILKPIRGRGYIDTGKNVISEFYTPLVPKDYEFLEEIGKAYTEKMYRLGHRKETLEELEEDIVCEL